MRISQRTATLSDAAALLTWRNDPSVRKYAQNSEHISIDEHQDWFKARLQRTKLEPFFLFEDDSRLIGMSRLDMHSQSLDKFEISILIDPSEHGKGFGTRILTMTCESFFGQYPEKSITAKVHRNNQVSQNLFISAGFELVTISEDFLDFEKNIRFEISSFL
jgi:UDP-2,4-diacetamido-2,4,6-trideoxy-beta-L-altropyranose hydrolase